MSFSFERAIRLLGGGFWDAEQPDPAYSKHFQYASGASADAHASPESRKVIRERVRLEFANNPYVQGIVRTHVNSVIGTGPRLHIDSQSAGTTDEIADQIQAAFSAWAIASKFTERLRMSFQAELVDGEGIALLASDKNQRHPVKLAWKCIECDQLTAPLSKLSIPDDRHVDGIDIDEFGSPVRYYFLKRHPGSQNSFSSMLEHAPAVDADQVIHLFRRDRPGQHRGVSRCQAMLMPAASMRQYTMATIKAARRAAALAVILKTDNPEVDLQQCVPYDLVELPDDGGMTLPAGYDVTQFKAEQPVGTYTEFNREMIRMKGRVFGMPLNKASADSSGYNYASGRLDHQDYGLLCRVERTHLACDAADRTVVAWSEEAVLRDMGDLLSDEARSVLDAWLSRPERFPPHVWHWDEPEHADPEKEAKADDIRLRNYTSSMMEVCAKKNKDWRRHLEQIALEQEKKRALGITESQTPNAEAPEREPEPEDAAA